MLNPVSTNDPRQDAQSLLQKQIQQKQHDEARNVRNNQQPSSLNAQRTDEAAQKQLRPEPQNSQQVKGASLDVRA
jgi:hypothetical protein